MSKKNGTLYLGTSLCQISPGFSAQIHLVSMISRCPYYDSMQISENLSRQLSERINMRWRPAANPKGCLLLTVIGNSALQNRYDMHSCTRHRNHTSAGLEANQIFLKHGLAFLLSSQHPELYFAKRSGVILHR